ncbi:hypothetical protein [Sphingomonas sp.]|uniref:hypothetical protein n=1 Tax=Sphingomonas sp. TaxID=28214 RepID=UPI0035C8541C
MRWMMTAVPAVLWLAACSADGDADYNRVAVPEREARAQAAIEQAAASNGAAATATTGVPIAPPTRNALGDRALPIDFVGYWGITPDDCELANTAATGRINIDGDTIRFYEAKARVESLQRRSPYAVTAVLRFSGEGQTWRTTDRLLLEAGGTRLVRIQAATGDRPATTLRYRKC